MTGNLNRRLEVIERSYDRPGIPGVIGATYPLPEAPSREAIERWLAAGTAHIAFRGHAVFYDGGRPKLTVAEWQAKFGGPPTHAIII